MLVKMVGVLVASDFTQHNNERDLINWKLLHSHGFTIFGGSANSNQFSVILIIFKTIARCQSYCILVVAKDSYWNEMAYTANNLYTGTDQVSCWQ